jgi:hypothetical protein
LHSILRFQSLVSYTLGKNKSVKSAKICEKTGSGATKITTYNEYIKKSYIGGAETQRISFYNLPETKFRFGKSNAMRFLCELTFAPIAIKILRPLR